MWCRQPFVQDDHESSAGSSSRSSSCSSSSSEDEANFRGPLQLVVLQHGVDGHEDDLACLREELNSQALEVLRGKGADLKIWSTSCNHERTHEGAAACGQRLLADLTTWLTTFRSLRPAPRLTVIGHSFGGILLRWVVVRLLRARARGELSFELDCFVTLATPHCGARQLGRKDGLHRDGLKGVRRFFKSAVMRLASRFVVGQTGRELMLDDRTLDTLADQEHLAALRTFNRRFVFANVTGDWIVPFHTSSLLDAEEARRVANTLPAAGHSLHDEATRQKLGLCTLGPFSDAWDKEDGGRRSTRSIYNPTIDWGQAERCCDMLRALRSIGYWEVHPVYPPECCDFPHVNITGRWVEDEPQGIEAIRYLAAELTKHFARDLNSR